MNTQENDLIRLESTIFSKTNEQKTSRLVSKLRQFWNLLIESMITVGELKARASQNKFGKTHWTIDDSFIGRLARTQTRARRLHTVSQIKLACYSQGLMLGFVPHPNLLN